MRRFFPIFLFGLFCWSPGSGANAESIQAHHARVELVCAQSNIVPGRELWLGIHFSLEKNWHIYWLNPGDSGQPPVLQWQLPTGFVAGAIQWPLPEKLTRSTLADYGYQDDVTLLAPVRVAAGMKTGDKADIGLLAKWLICADVCIPDHAQLHLSLPISSTPGQASAQASSVNDAKKRLPQSLPRSWKAWAVSSKDGFTLVINAGKPIGEAQFFPLLPDQIENAAPQPLKQEPRGLVITLKKSDQLLKPVHVLQGLLVLSSGESYVIEAAVTSTRHNGVVLN